MNYVIRAVTWKAARAGIITGVLLAVARISGETAPLLFTAFNNQFFSTDVNAPMASLPAVIFQFAMSPYDDWHALAWAGALLVTATVLVLSIIARMLETRNGTDPNGRRRRDFRRRQDQDRHQATCISFTALPRRSRTSPCR